MDPAQFVVAEIPMWGQLVPASPGAKKLGMLARQYEWTIGRHKTCDFIVPAPTISNKHCVLSWDPARPAEVTVEDLSTNGTFINDALIRKGNRMELRDGDELRIANDDYPFEQAGNCHRYIYRHLGHPCGPSIFDQYTLSSAEVGARARQSHWKAIRTRDGKTFTAVIIHTRRNDRAWIPGMLTEATRLVDAPAHPNILASFAVFTTHNGLQIVTERCGGETLPDVMLQHPKGMDEARAQTLSRDICSGLEFLHARGIFLPCMTQEGVLVVAGRGKLDATRAGYPDDDERLFVCMRPGFRPPPLLVPEWPLDRRGPPGAENVWSAGILGALMLTGRLQPDDDPEKFDDSIQPCERRAAIDWEALGTKSAEAQDWVRGMLQNHPYERMALRGALEHPWLREAALPV